MRRFGSLDKGLEAPCTLRLFSIHLTAIGDSSEACIASCEPAVTSTVVCLSPQRSAKSRMEAMDMTWIIGRAETESTRYAPLPVTLIGGSQKCCIAKLIVHKA